MQYVEIYKLQNDGSQKAIVICKLIDGAVKCEGDEMLIQYLEKEGIRDYSQLSPQNPKLYFKDGLRFLEQLKYNFKSGYLNASEVKE